MYWYYKLFSNLFIFYFLVFILLGENIVVCSHHWIFSGGYFCVPWPFGKQTVFWDQPSYFFSSFGYFFLMFDSLVDWGRCYKPGQNLYQLFFPFHGGFHTSHCLEALSCAKYANRACRIHFLPLYLWLSFLFDPTKLCKCLMAEMYSNTFFL